jgi:hypothetical protein
LVPEIAFWPQFDQVLGEYMTVMFPDITTSAWEPCSEWELRAQTQDEKEKSGKIGLVFQVICRFFRT